MMNNNEVTSMLTTVLLCMVCVLFVLIFIYFLIRTKSNKKKNASANTNYNANANSATQGYDKQSIFKFMEFDKIEDNMIVQKNGKKYLMVVECQGVNYDLMSGIEKTSVEEGFAQFLNTLRHPIQIYTQTRTVNLEDSISTYRNRISQIESDLRMKEVDYQSKVKSGRYSKEQLDKEYYELTKQRNLYEYGKDVIYNTERMSANRNVLNKKYYIIIPYYPEDIGNSNFDNEELKNIAFSELYTRSQSVIRTLSACGINGKILGSNLLVDLLYVAYNRDEQEVFGLDKALAAGYDELYSTAPDILDKKMHELDKHIQQKAMDMANDAVLFARTDKQRQIEETENNMDDLISQMAKLIIEENRSFVGDDIAEAAIDKIDGVEETIESEIEDEYEVVEEIELQEKPEPKKRGRKKANKEVTEEGGNLNNVKEEKKTTRGRRTTKTA